MVDDLCLLPEHETHGPPERKCGEWLVCRIQEKDLAHQTASAGIRAAAAQQATTRRDRRLDPAELSSTCTPATRTSSGANPKLKSV
jgi:hypothetical protein